jgi:uncharacterized membrane protein YkvI
VLVGVFRKYVLPGLIFQSVVVAGGYGTGRELVEFFLSRGPVGGLLAMGLSTVIWSLVAAVSFELARTFRAFDYRTFFRRLLGPAWVLFDVTQVTLTLLVSAVIAAAAGEIFEATFALPYQLGVLTVVTAIAYLVFRGSATIERVFAAWSGVLYILFIVLFVWSFREFGGEILAAFGSHRGTEGWVAGGLSYAGYNVSVVPVILYVIRHHESRREAVGAGLLAGPIAIFPGLLFFVALTGLYPGVLDQAVPANLLLESLGSRAFQITYQVVLFGTLIETGAGMIHAINDRIAVAYEERRKPLPRSARPLFALLLLGTAALLARFGLIELIAKGYGSLTWVYLAVFVIPVLTRGVRLLRLSGPGPSG